LSETEREEKRKIKLFALLSASERGWGRGQIRLVELTLIVSLSPLPLCLFPMSSKIRSDRT
ncbi:MAG: hypothetical protein ACYTXT_15530, partial [Nostoc sp.]